MAYPASYDIKYYKGDTLEFRIFPKNTSGLAFDLSQFTVKFTVATARGNGATSYDGYAVVGADSSSNLTYIKCAILPGLGSQLEPNIQYVYDVEVRREPESGETYPYVYTLLTGTITVTDQVTGAL
jgi:hypothetical protein